MSSCIHYEPSAGMMSAYALKESFKMNDFSLVVLIICFQWLKKTTRATVLPADTPIQITSHAS
jgi:hypothetical protein